MVCCPPFAAYLHSMTLMGPQEQRYSSVHPDFFCLIGSVCGVVPTPSITFMMKPMLSDPKQESLVVCRKNISMIVQIITKKLIIATMVTVF